VVAPSLVDIERTAKIVSDLKILPVKSKRAKHRLDSQPA
jgi:hypothetical protein